MKLQEPETELMADALAIADPLVLAAFLDALGLRVGSGGFPGGYLMAADLRRHAREIRAYVEEEVTGVRPAPVRRRTS